LLEMRRIRGRGIEQKGEGIQDLNGPHGPAWSGDHFRIDFAARAQSTRRTE
jgi:hypothetical protein